MDRNEFIVKLQKVYVGDKNAFNEIVKKHEDLVSYARDLEDEICNLKEENQRLKEDIKIKDGIHETTFKNLMEARRENERLKNIIYTTLEYVDREEVSSVGTPFTSTSIGKEIKELLEGEKTFNSIWEENQRLNNVLNELEGDLCAIYNSFETTNNDILKKYLKKDIYLCRFKELKESDKS